MDPGDLLQRFGREFPRGTVLFREGDPGGEMYVVSRGKVSISARGRRRSRRCSRRSGQGEFFGEMSILNDAPRSATATCVEDCLLLVVDARTFEAMVRGQLRDCGAHDREAGRAARRGRPADREPAPPRHAGPGGPLRPGRGGARGAGVPFALSPEDLAARLDVDARQAADVVRTLERSGLLSGTEGAWTVPDAERLRHFLDLLQLDARSGTRP